MSATTNYNPKAVSVGAGVLYIAAIGTAEPTSVSSVYDAGFVPLGYTDQGHTFTVDQQTSDVEVAESLDPILVSPTGRTITVALALAEMTAKHLQAALGGGTISSAGGTVTYLPPKIGIQTPVMLAWDSVNQDERMLWRKCVATGTVAIARQKAPNKATIPVSFRALTPDNASLDPFEYFGDSTFRS